MNRIKTAVKIGFVWTIFLLLFGCAQTGEKALDQQVVSQNTQIEFQYDQIEYQYSQIEFQYDQIEYQKKLYDQMKSNLDISLRSNLALDEKNKALESRLGWLMKTNSALKKHSQELTMKIDMLKTLDHEVEEKRQTFIDH
jgi:hypothetical protein